MGYIFNISKTGALRKTPRKVIRKIIGEIHVENNIRIIEIGAGRGEITREIIQKLGRVDNIIYYAFEIDTKFAGILENTFPSIRVETTDGLHFEDAIPSEFKADYIISSMPLSFYSKEKRKELYTRMKSRLAENGKILILFHAFWIYPGMKKYLGCTRLIKFITLPPYLLLISE